MVGTKHNRAVCALAVVIAGALALAGCATQTSRAAGSQKVRAKRSCSAWESLQCAELRARGSLPTFCAPWAQNLDN